MKSSDAHFIVARESIQPTKAISGLVMVVVICRKPSMLPLIMHRMYELSCCTTNVHALIKSNITPVPPLAGKFHCIAGGHFLNFFSSRPQTRSYAVAVFGAHGNGNNSDSFIESATFYIFLDRIVNTCSAPF